MHLDPQRIRDAQSLLARHFGPTPIARAASLSSPEHDVFLKIETGLPTGSFKVRGALCALSQHPEVRDVVCASTGNHGAAVAYAARLLGVRATIFLPHDPNPVKAARILALGARIVKAGVDLSAAIDAAQQYVDREGAFFLHDASDPDVPVGTATIGAEILDQLPEVDVIYVPMGDTALIRGVAAAAKQRRAVRIVGVVAERAPAYQLSWQRARDAKASRLRAGAPARRADLGAESREPTGGDVVETETCDTIADGLAVRRPLAPNVAAICDLVDEVVAVSEQEMRDAIGWLRAREDVIAEPPAAATTAAFLARSHSTGPTRRDGGRGLADPAVTTTVLLVTGGNLAPGIA